MKEVTSVSEYLSEISRINKNLKYVFRGENQIFCPGCIPGIFRDNSRYMIKNYELNILNKIRSEKIDNSNSSFFLTAIEAQHGGFPSRLLDVTFNALIALHFAVTPHYMVAEDKYDKEDGIVYMIEYDKMISPVSDDINEMYEDLLYQRGYRSKYPVFSYNHYFIDHYKKNTRINVQQGAFILFFGSEYRPLPENITNRIKIKNTSKNKIRKELEDYFSISNAFVYPEPNNLLKNVKKSSIDYIDNVLTITTELVSSLRSIKNTIKYSVDNNHTKIFIDLLQEIEGFEDLIVKVETSKVELLNDIDQVECSDDLKKICKEYPQISFDSFIDEFRIKFNKDSKLNKKSVNNLKKDKKNKILNIIKAQECIKKNEFNKNLIKSTIEIEKSINDVKIDIMQFEKVINTDSNELKLEKECDKDILKNTIKKNNEDLEQILSSFKNMFELYDLKEKTNV